MASKLVLRSLLAARPRMSVMAARPAEGKTHLLDLLGLLQRSVVCCGGWLVWPGKGVQV